MEPTPDSTITPRVSVIVVSDYGADIGHRWDTLSDTLASLAGQDVRCPHEVVVCQSTSAGDVPPAHLIAKVPAGRLLRIEAKSSQALKNAAVAATKAPLIALVDADVVLARDWLRRSLETMDARPEVAVVSGRTFHPADGFVPRALALLERGYVDQGDAGPTQFIGNHACMFRREWFEAHPCDEVGGPFSSRVQSEAILRAGGSLYFEPTATSYHAYNGWQAQHDIFRNAGAGTIVSWRRDPKMRFAWLTRLGPAAIPILVLAKIATSFRLGLLRFRAYGLRAHEVPSLLLLTIAARSFEAPGMWHALRNRALKGSAFH